MANDYAAFRASRGLGTGFRREIPGSARLFAIVGIAGAIALCLDRDTHGPPILIGLLLSSAFRGLPISATVHRGVVA